MHTDFTAAASFTWYTLGMADSGDRQAFAASTSADRVSILHDAASLPDVGPDQFNASGYAAAEPVSGSGRGGAWFVHSAAGDAVLKHYRRGGKAAWLSEDAYLYVGDARVRSFAEYRLLRRLREKGLPVPEPLAAFCRRRGLTYRAALLTRRIPQVSSLAECVDEGRAPWTAVGETLARLHRAGARHSDLNAHNILLDTGGGIHVIDWDKGRLMPGPGPWCAQVLERLVRSLRKDCRLPPTELTLGLDALRMAHDGALA